MRFSLGSLVFAVLATTGAVSAAVTCAAGEHIATNARGVLVCRPCPKGTYNASPVTGSAPTTCTDCPAGTFVSVTGAKTCCTCCEGYYQSSTGATNCKACRRADGGEFSPVGATSSTQCGNFVPGVTGANNACVMSGDVCPGTQQGNNPQGSIVKRKRDIGCARGFKKCMHMSGRGGFDCVDIANDPESCGDCVAPFGVTLTSESEDEYTGKDCTAIPGVSVAGCKRGSCYVDSCRKGWTRSSDGKTCRPVVIATQKRSVNGL